MILQTPLRSSLISKRFATLVAVAAAVFASVMATGCGDGGPQLYVNRGYVNLDALMHRSPGWRNVVLLDGDLAHVGTVGAPVTQIAYDRSLTALSPLADLLPGSSAGISVLESDELTQRADRDVWRMAERRAMSRERLLERLNENWQLESSDQYDSTVERIYRDYGQRVNMIYSEQNSKRLNLELQIGALIKILVDWAGSGPPPTPRLNAARQDLVVKRLALQQITGKLTEDLSAARADRDEQLAEAIRVRNSYVADQTQKTRDTLEKADEIQLAAERARLQQQVLQLSQDSAEAQRVSVHRLDAVHPVTIRLSSVPAPPDSRADKSAALFGLLQQRKRRVAFIYESVRSSALDVAAQKHWEIDFTKSGSRETDLTDRVAALIAARSND